MCPIPWNPFSTNSSSQTLEMRGTPQCSSIAEAFNRIRESNRVEVFDGVAAKYITQVYEGAERLHSEIGKVTVNPNGYSKE